MYKHLQLVKQSPPTHPLRQALLWPSVFRPLWWGFQSRVQFRCLVFGRHSVLLASKVSLLLRFNRWIPTAEAENLWGRRSQFVYRSTDYQSHFCLFGIEIRRSVSLAVKYLTDSSVRQTERQAVEERQYNNIPFNWNDNLTIIRNRVADK